MLRGVACIDATKDDYTLDPHHGRDVAVLTPHTDEAHATVVDILIRWAGP
jgi:hypothetical protein